MGIFPRIRIRILEILRSGQQIKAKVERSQFRFPNARGFPLVSKLIMRGVECVLIHLFFFQPSRVLEPFLDLSLPIPIPLAVAEHALEKKKKPEPKISAKQVSDLLDLLPAARR